MKAVVEPVEKPGELVEYLEPRTESVERKDGELIVEMEEPEKLSQVPGIEKYTVEGEEREGLGGKPIHREAFTRIESREDAAKAFLATVEGYTLYIDTDREWDLRSLKKYNSEIVQAGKEVADELDIQELDGDFNLSREQLLGIYQEFLAE